MKSNEQKLLNKKILIFVIIYVLAFILSIIGCLASGMSLRDIFLHSLVNLT